MSKIVKAHRKTGFAMVSNLACNDSALSFKALGLLTHLMHYPQDWDIRVDYIAKVRGVGKAAIYSAINELIEAGYMQRTRVYENGRFSGWDYVVSDEKIFAGMPETLAEEPTETDISVFNNSEFRKAENYIDEFNKPRLLYNKHYKQINTLTVDFEKVDGACPSDQEGEESKTTIAKIQKEVEATPAIAKTTKEKTDDAPKIIELLNEITGRAFRPSGSSLCPIRARLREGFTMDDFSAVIRLKNAQWANRADMRQYLRPETLFGNKFDSYLQEAKALAATKIPVVEGETDDYRKYLRWCETYYPNLGANFVLDERTNYDLTKGKAYDNHRTLLPKSALLAHYREAHRICNEQVARTGVCKGVKAVYVELINQAIK